MNTICKNYWGGFLFSLMLLVSSCSSTIKWDKVNVDPLTNTVTFKKNNEKVSGTVAKGEKKGAYEEMLVEEGTVVYTTKYQDGKIVSQVDNRIRKTTNYKEDGTIGNAVYKTADGRDSLQIDYYADGSPMFVVDNTKRKSTIYYVNGQVERVVLKTVDGRDSVKMKHNEAGVLVECSTFNYQTLQDTVRYFAEDGTLRKLQAFHDKQPVHTAVYFKGGKMISSETIWVEDGESIRKNYDNQGGLIEVTYYSPKNVPMESNEYTNGKRTKVTVFDDKGEVYSVNGQRIFPVMDGVQLISYKTGFYHLYDITRYLWAPAVLMKWKNVSGATIEESIKLVGTFLNGEEEFNEQSVYLHSEYSDNPMEAGLVRQEALISGTGYTSVAAIPHANIECKIYVNDKLYTTFKISKRELYSNRF